MIKNGRYNLAALFTPLDLATILYVLLTGAYLCFSTAPLGAVMPHLVIRIVLLVIITCLAVLATRLPENKVLLFLRSLYPLLLLGFFYPETSCMKNIIFHSDLDKHFFNAEQNLWHCQPSLEFSKNMGQAWFNEIMNLCYFSYYLLIGLTCIALYFKQGAGRAARGIFIVMFSFYLYYVVFALLPVVGPKYYILGADTQPPATHLFGKLMHYILLDFEKPTGAFPSSHAGIAIVIAYITYTQLPRLFLVVLPFAIGICFATVYIKEHYLVDVIAGIFTAPVFIILSGKVYNKFLSYGAKKNAQEPTLQETRFKSL